MDKDDIILKPKGGNKKLTKVKKEIVQARKDEEYKNVVVKTDLELKVDKSAIDLIKKLKYFQDRMHNNNPTKVLQFSFNSFAINTLFRLIQKRGYITV